VICRLEVLTGKRSSCHLNAQTLPERKGLGRFLTWWTAGSGGSRDRDHVLVEFSNCNGIITFATHGIHRPDHIVVVGSGVLQRRGGIVVHGIGRLSHRVARKGRKARSAVAIDDIVVDGDGRAADILGDRRPVQMNCAAGKGGCQIQDGRRLTGVQDWSVSEREVVSVAVARTK
jgi:hypothetical protein